MEQQGDFAALSRATATGLPDELRGPSHRSRDRDACSRLQDSRAPAAGGTISVHAVIVSDDCMLEDAAMKLLFPMAALSLLAAGPVHAVDSGCKSELPAIGDALGRKSGAKTALTAKFEEAQRLCGANRD